MEVYDEEGEGEEYPAEDEGAGEDGEEGEGEVVAEEEEVEVKSKAKLCFMNLWGRCTRHMCSFSHVLRYEDLNIAHDDVEEVFNSLRHTETNHCKIYLMKGECKCDRHSSDRIHKLTIHMLSGENQIFLKKMIDGGVSAQAGRGGRTGRRGNVGGRTGGARTTTGGRNAGRNAGRGRGNSGRQGRGGRTNDQGQGQGALVPYKTDMVAKNKEKSKKQDQELEETKKKLQDLEMTVKMMSLNNTHNIELLKLKNELELVKATSELDKKLIAAEISQRNHPVVYHHPVANVGILGSPYPGSNYCGNGHFDTLRSWLGGRVNFLFLYRASTHGSTAVTFHNHCNNQGPTITIVRSSAGYLFGGYNPESWTSRGGYCSSGGSFIFTITNPYGSGMYQFSSANSNGAYDNAGYGPTWGGGHDLHINSNISSNSNYANFPHSYSDPLGNGNNTFTGSRNFSVTDYEVSNPLFPHTQLLVFPKLVKKFISFKYFNIN